MQFHLLMLGTFQSDSKYVELKSHVFCSCLNICFLNVYGLQRTEWITVVKSRSWFLSLWVLHNLGLGKYLNSKSCAYFVWQVFFSGILVPQVLTDLGALGSRSCFFRSVGMSKLCVASFSSASMCCAVNWKCIVGKLEETGATHPVYFLSFSLGYWLLKCQVTWFLSVHFKQLYSI